MHATQGSHLDRAGYAEGRGHVSFLALSLSESLSCPLLPPFSILPHAKQGLGGGLSLSDAKQGMRATQGSHLDRAEFAEGRGRVSLLPLSLCLSLAPSSLPFPFSLMPSRGWGVVYLSQMPSRGCVQHRAPTLTGLDLPRAAAM